MHSRKPPRAPPVSPQPVVLGFRERLSRRELQGLEAAFALRTTTRQLDHALTGWMANTAASPARFQILMLLWAAKGCGVPHRGIVAVLGVTRATVSGLMVALESEGLVTSTVARGDRRRLLASLTSRGKTVIGKAVETSAAKLRAAFGPFSSEDLGTFVALLRGVRDSLAAAAEPNRSEAGRPTARRIHRASHGR